ncbi:DUF3137 domain-containing protein [Paenibacillus sp. CAU 1782]
MLFPAADQQMQSVDTEANSFERERLKYKKAYWSCFFVLSLLLILALTTLVLQVRGVGIALALITLLAFIATAMLLWRKRYFFRERFKQELIPGVLRQLFQEPHNASAGADNENVWIYRPDGAIDEKRIRQSRMFDDAIDEITGEDYLAGQLGATRFEFSELKLVRLDEDNERPVKHKVSLFKGVLFIADFHTKLQGRTILQARSLFGIGNVFSRAFHAIANQFRDEEDKMVPVKMEYNSFNQLYEIYSTNEHEARSIFSHALMERMVRAKNYHPRIAAISFVDSSMYAAVKSNRGYLEPDMAKPIAKQMENVRDEVLFVLGLIQLMGLNNGGETQE